MQEPFDSAPVEELTSLKLIVEQVIDALKSDIGAPALIRYIRASVKLHSCVLVRYFGRAV